MALYTVFLGGLFGNSPGMGPVAFFALHAGDPDVEVMFAHIDNVSVAVQTVTPVGPGRLMGLVACVAIILHRRISRNNNFNRLLNGFRRRLIMLDIYRAAGDQLPPDFLGAVAKETFLPLGLEILCPVGMTVKAGDLSHPDAMDNPSLMTLHAEPLFGSEFMHDVSVAFRALYLFHEHMICMEL